MNKILSKLFVALIVVVFFTTPNAEAYTGCEEYGYMAYAVGNSCQCMSGYAFGKDFMGNTACISLNTMCTDKLGYNARYNSLYDRCECGYGYVIDGGRCTNGDMVCHSKHGIYSSYNDYDNSCECDSGYTLDRINQCVKKQNNVYFTLKELDTDNKLAVIKSDYDYSYYSIRYNTGCYSFSFRRYLNDQIVVNLGTDYDLDTWDKIVLQDDDETCDIVSRQKVDSSYTLFPEEDEESNSLSYAQIAELNRLIAENNTSKPSVKVVEKPKQVMKTTGKKEPVVQQNITNEKPGLITTPANVAGPVDELAQEKKTKWYNKILNWFKRK